MLKKYDKRAIPSEYGEPVNVSVQILVAGFTTVARLGTTQFNFDLYIRKSWRDYRLAFGELSTDANNSYSNQPIAFTSDVVKKIWTPNLYFTNQVKSKVYTLTKPNMVLLLQKDGFVLYSQRISLVVSCILNLTSFPFDRQHCTFPIESYSYPSTSLRLLWNTSLGGPLIALRRLSMSEFSFDGYDYEVTKTKYNNYYDSIHVTMHLSRDINHYILQVYFPYNLIVMLSWVGFWIDYRAANARVVLDITSMLTITMLGNSIRPTFPNNGKDHTSADWYILTCFLFVFLALIEYALVNITNRILKDRLSKDSLLAQPEKNSLKKSENIKERKSQQPNNQEGKENAKRKQSYQCIKDNNKEHQKDESKSRRQNKILCNPCENQLQFSHLQQTHKKIHNKSVFQKSKEVTRKMYRHQKRNKEVHIIDRISRYAFPISFLLVNLGYFITSFLRKD